MSLQSRWKLWHNISPDFFRVGKNYKRLFYQRKTQHRNAGTQGRDHRLTEDEMYNERLKSKNSQMNMKLEGTG